jgi:D-3-phosphoglycerate dehydrogenase
LTAENRGSVGASALASLKPTGFVLNFARGGIVDEEALLQLLSDRKIQGAAMDVFSVEPLSPDHPFWALDNVLITPHLGGFTEDYPERSLPQIIENMRLFLRGETARMIDARIV